MQVWYFSFFVLVLVKDGAALPACYVFHIVFFATGKAGFVVAFLFTLFAFDEDDKRALCEYWALGEENIVNFLFGSYFLLHRIRPARLLDLASVSAYCVQKAPELGAMAPICRHLPFERRVFLPLGVHVLFKS